MARALLSALFLFAASLSAQAQDNPIVGRLEAFREAYNAADAVAVSGFYAADAALLPPQASAQIGRLPIAAHYAAAFDAGVSNLRMQIREIRRLGPEAALAIGETLIDLGEQSILGRFLHIWEFRDEEWMLTRDIYHVVAVQ